MVSAEAGGVVSTVDGTAVTGVAAHLTTLCLQSPEAMQTTVDSGQQEMQGVQFSIV